MRNKMITIALSLLALGATQGQAQSMHPQLDAKHSFILGAFDQDADAKIHATADGRPGTELDLDTLGMKGNDTTWMLEYRYRFLENWAVTVGAFTFDTSGSVEAERDFVYDGVEFTAGAKLETELDIDTYIVDVMYSAYKTDRAEIMVGGGLHIFDLGTSIKAEAFIGEEERSSERGTSNMLAPLPNLRMQGFYALSPKWALLGTLGWLSFNVDDYDGSFSYLHLRTTYRFTDRFGVGVGYQYVDIDVTEDRSRGEIGLNAQFDGPTLHLAYSF